MALEREEIEHLSGVLAAQSTALRTLVRLLHANGVLDGRKFITAIEQLFHEPDAQFHQQNYTQLSEIREPTCRRNFRRRAAARASSKPRRMNSYSSSSRSLEPKIAAMKITDPIYSDENKAREHLEKLQWPNGAVCPHCGNGDGKRIASLKGKSTRPGVYKCKECRKPFSVTVGTVMERSKIPLTKWLAAMYLMTASKKGVSAHQLHRMLGITYESAWFLAHRLREAMKPEIKSSGPLGGSNKVIEADETFMGGKAKNRAFKPEPKKYAIATLVERDGRAMSFPLRTERPRRSARSSSNTLPVSRSA